MVVFVSLKIESVTGNCLIGTKTPGQAIHKIRDKNGTKTSGQAIHKIRDTKKENVRSL